MDSSTAITARVFSILILPILLILLGFLLPVVISVSEGRYPGVIWKGVGREYFYSLSGFFDRNLREVARFRSSVGNFRELRRHPAPTGRGSGRLSGGWRTRPGLKDRPGPSTPGAAGRWRKGLQHSSTPPLIPGT